MASPATQNPNPTGPNPTDTPTTTTSNIELTDISTTTQDILQSQIEQARHRVPIRTYHCSFCNHLLIATTHDIASLPRRKAPALDNAIILPLPEGEEEEDEEVEVDEEEEEDNNNNADDDDTNDTPTKTTKNKDTTSKSTSKSKHYTILLSTTSPDRKPIILRRSDGFEKRLLVRCGRCKVVLGYVLDEVHFGKGVQTQAQTQTETQQGESDNSAPGVIYVLPGAVTETGDLEREIQVEREEWSGWEELGKGRS